MKGLTKGLRNKLVSNSNRENNKSNSKEARELIGILEKDEVGKLKTLFDKKKINIDQKIEWGRHRNPGELVKPFFIAATSRNVKMITLFLNNGASVHEKTDSDETALHFTAMHSGSEPDIVDKLVDAGININAQDSDRKFTALHCACQQRNHGVVRKLLKHLAKTSLKDINGNTPLAIAESMGCDQTVELLKKTVSENKSVDEKVSMRLEVVEQKLEEQSMVLQHQQCLLNTVHAEFHRSNTGLNRWTSAPDLVRHPCSPANVSLDQYSALNNPGSQSTGRYASGMTMYHGNAPPGGITPMGNLSCVGPYQHWASMSFAGFPSGHPSGPAYQSVMPMPATFPTNMNPVYHGYPQSIGAHQHYVNFQPSISSSHHSIPHQIQPVPPALCRPASLLSVSTADGQTHNSTDATSGVFDVSFPMDRSGCSASATKETALDDKRPDRPLQLSRRRYISVQSNLEALVNNMKADIMITKLLTKNVMSLKNYSKIKDKTPHDQNMHIVIEEIMNGTNSDFDIFIEILREESPYLAELLDADYADGDDPVLQ